MRPSAQRGSRWGKLAWVTCAVSTARRQPKGTAQSILLFLVPVAGAIIRAHKQHKEPKRASGLTATCHQHCVPPGEGPESVSTAWHLVGSQLPIGTAELVLVTCSKSREWEQLQGQSSRYSAENGRHGFPWLDVSSRRHKHSSRGGSCHSHSPTASTASHPARCRPHSL